jgi:glycosyltransferase involved in cell wall biosynthesis
MVEAFPNADIITLSYNPDTTLPEFRNYRIKTSLLNRLINSHKRFKILFPLATAFMSFWNIARKYDIVLMSSATSAKYLSKKNAAHICYCYFPTRAIWNENSYFSKDSRKFVHYIFKLALPLLRWHDNRAAQRIDRFIAISKTTQDAIKEIYNKNSDVLISPIPVEKFRVGLKESKKPFFLLVSRLEYWKRVDYAIEAFNRLGMPLRIIGSGDDESRLKSMAKNNIEFLGGVSMDELILQYGQARAVIFTPALEYGLVPIEAVAAGTPVIALGYGGVLETMLGVQEAELAGTKPTAVFFYQQTADALIEAVHQFDRMTFCRETLSAYADRFAVESFKGKLREIIEQEIRVIESKYQYPKN